MKAAKRGKSYHSSRQPAFAPDAATVNVMQSWRPATESRLYSGGEGRILDMSTNHWRTGVQQSMADHTASTAVRSDVPVWRELAELMLAGHSPLAFTAGHLLLALQPLMTVLGVSVPRSRILQLMGLPPMVRHPKQAPPDDDS